MEAPATDAHTVEHPRPTSGVPAASEVPRSKSGTSWGSRPDAADALRDALAGAALFQALALCFRYPDADTPRALAALLEEVPHRWRAPLAEVAERVAEAGEERYMQLFGSRGSCRDSEAAYVVDRPAGALLADVAGFYRAFSFPWSMAKGQGSRAKGQGSTSTRDPRPATRDPRPPSDPLDHIATELSFVAFLFAKEAHGLFHGDMEAAEVCRSGRALFLREHLGIWIRRFAESVAQQGEQTFYGRSAAVAAEVVADLAGDRGSDSVPQPAPGSALSILWEQAAGELDAGPKGCDACPAACGEEEEEWP